MAGSSACADRGGRRGRFPRARGVLIVGVACLALPVLATAPVARPAAEPGALVERAGDAITGVTVDALGHALAGVQILVAPAIGTDPSSPVQRVASDAQGRFRVEGLTPGRYRLVALKNGYALLVSRVDTLVRSTVDLVLRPAGVPAEPGTRPRDASWILRLPDRDVLEDLAAGVEPAERLARAPAVASAVGPAPARIPLTVRFDGAQESGSGAPRGAGWGLDAAGTWIASRLGTLALEASHRRLGERDGPRRDEDRLAATWTTPTEGGAARLGTVSLTAARRDRGLGAPDRLTDVLEREARMSAGYRRLSANSSLESSVEAEFIEFSEKIGRGARETASNLSVLARTVFEVTPRAGVTHAASVELSTASARPGGLGTSADTVIGTTASRDLDGLSGSRARVSYEQTRRVGPAVTLFGRASVESDSDAVGGAGAGRIESGLLWQFAPSWAITVRGGVADAGRGGGRPLFAVSAERSGRRWTLRALRDREVGGSDPRIGLDGAGRQASVLLAARDAVIDRWLAEARWSPRRPGLPSLVLRASWSSLEGDAAARLPDDLARLPVVRDARADRFLMAMDVRFAASGTVVGMSVEDVDQEGGTRGFVSGARGWTRRSLTVRQRLGEGEDPGSGLYLLFGIAQTDPALDPGASVADEPVSPRLALLDRRRVSGGLALAF